MDPRFRGDDGKERAREPPKGKPLAAHGKSAPRYSVVAPSKCSSFASASSLVAWTMPSLCSGGA